MDRKREREMRKRRGEMKKQMSSNKKGEEIKGREDGEERRKK